MSSGSNQPSTGAGGYDIAASLSNASTTTSAVGVAANTVFNFNSPYASGGYNPLNVAPNDPATATSATAKGPGAEALAQASGLGAGSTGSNAASQGAASGGLGTWLLYGALGYGAYLLFKHFHHAA